MMRVRLSEDVQSTVVEGSTVILDARNGTYLGTNDVGARIFELLRQDDDPERIIAAILDEYAVSEDQVRRDVQKLLDQLAARGLVTITEDRPMERAERGTKERRPWLKAVLVLTLILALAVILLLFVVK